MVKPLVPPMVDILGPYTTTEQHVVSRPGKTGDAAGAGFSWWKDCTDENSEDGTPIPAVALNNFKAQLLTLCQAAGIDIDDDDAMVAYAVQSGFMNYAVATGTANAWVVAPPLDVPAYGAGRVLWVVAPATNTATIVNANVSGLGNRRVKKSDGTDPAIGDIIGGRLYPTVDDGTNIRVVYPLASDIVDAVAASPPILSVFIDSTPGTRTFTPTTTGWYEVVLVGGGGGGGGGIGTGGGGGGAGGGVVVDYVYLIAGTAYTYTIGTGGALGGPGFNGSAGTSTSLVGPAGTVVATGGGAGGGAGAGVGGFGASAGSGSGQSALGGITAGQPGFQGSPQINQSGQGGSSPGGGFGGQASFGSGNNGSSPGGGASGGTNGNNGGTGANGRITLRALGV